MTIGDLKDELHARGESYSGHRDELRSRLYALRLRGTGGPPMPPEIGAPPDATKGALADVARVSQAPSDRRPSKTRQRLEIAAPTPHTDAWNSRNTPELPASGRKHDMRAPAGTKPEGPKPVAQPSPAPLIATPEMSRIGQRLDNAANRGRWPRFPFELLLRGVYASPQLPLSDVRDELWHRQLP